MLEIQVPDDINIGLKKELHPVSTEGNVIGFVDSGGERGTAIYYSRHGGLIFAGWRPTVQAALAALVSYHRDANKLCRYCGATAIKTLGYCVECWIEEHQVIPEQAELIRAGAIPHSVNCLECRRLNRIYCPKCCD